MSGTLAVRISVPVLASLGRCREILPDLLSPLRGDQDYYGLAPVSPRLTQVTVRCRLEHEQAVRALLNPARWP